MRYRAWDQSQGLPRYRNPKRRYTWAPTIRYTIEDEFFDVISSYNKEYIEHMKEKVPSRYRIWDPDLTIWKFSGKKYLAVIKWLLDYHYGGYVEEWPELSELDKMVRGMIRGAKAGAKKEWSAKELTL